MTFQFEGFDRRLHLDYETFSEEDLKTSGSHRYAAHESTEVLMLGWAVDDEPEELWDPLEGAMPERLRAELLRPETAKVAFNAQFERLITKHVLQIDVPREQWRCTMVASYYLGFNGGLDSVLSQSPIPFTKDPRGARLIQKFCKMAPRNHKVDRYTKWNSPKDFHDFTMYCRQDVRVERELLLWIAKYPMMHQWDWERYAMDQEINDRGAHIDVEMAAGAVEMWEEEKARIIGELEQLTGIPKATRGPFMEWLAEQGLALDNLRAETVDAAIAEGHFVPGVTRALELWREKEGKAVSKYARALKMVGEGDRVRGLFQFKGASRTDRTAGRGLQLQNLKRSVMSEEFTIAAAKSAFYRRDPEALSRVTGLSVSESLGVMIRHMIEAPAGHVLNVADLSSIESVVLGWIADCDTILNTFRNGRDTYKEFAVRYYNVDYDAVTKPQRTFSKPPVLGCGYMLGAKGLLKYASDMGVEMTEEEAGSAVATFRSMYPEVVNFWSWIYDSVIHVIDTWQPISGYRLHIERDEDFLRIWLPSGRAISYYQPAVKPRSAPWAEVNLTDKAGGYTLEQLRREFYDKDDQWLIDNGYITSTRVLMNVSYMGVDQKTTQWRRVFAHAGLFTENIVQSIALDILFEGIKGSISKGLAVFLQVHDEIGIESESTGVTERMELTLLEKAMTRIPHWGDSLWLGADGYTSLYYRKD